MRLCGDERDVVVRLLPGPAGLDGEPDTHG
jgi:hypothetical protein